MIFIIIVDGGGGVCVGVSVFEWRKFVLHLYILWHHDVNIHCGLHHHRRRWWGRLWWMLHFDGDIHHDFHHHGRRWWWGCGGCLCLWWHKFVMLRIWIFLWHHDVDVHYDLHHHRRRWRRRLWWMLLLCCHAMTHGVFRSRTDFC